MKEKIILWLYPRWLAKYHVVDGRVVSDRPLRDALIRRVVYWLDPNFSDGG